MERHLYRRTIKYVGKKKTPVKAWYYWYYDHKTGKQVRKSCGTGKKPVLSKKEADAIIEKLKEQDRDLLSIKGEAESVTIARLANIMFGSDDSDYIKQRRENGYLKEDDTLNEVRAYLKNVIVEKYGNLKPEEIDPVIIDRDLMATGNSASWRNRVVEILNWILDEAVWLKMIKDKPKLKKYKRNTKKKSILTREELDKLFPDNDFDQLSMIWTKKQEVSNEGIMFGVLYALMASTGLRSGEVRAISPSQLLLTDGKRIAKMVGADGREAKEPLGKTEAKIRYGLLLDRMFDKKSGKLKMHLKKGNEENRKWRIEPLSEKTVNYLQKWLAIRPLDKEPDLLFTFRERRINLEYIIYRLGVGLKNAGINTEGRNIKPHSMRYTYNTKMRVRIPENILRGILGHETKEMTDQYTVFSIAELYEQFMEMGDYSNEIDGFWGIKSPQ